MTALKETTLLGLNLQQLTEIMVEMGEASYRGRQLFEAIYQGRMSQIEEISTFSNGLRQRLTTEGVTIGFPSIRNKFVSSDETVRYLLAMADGQTVEAVWMPEGDGGESGDGSDAGDLPTDRKWNRATICISSQVGCAVDCQFCLTALLGVKRNLSAGEIVGQVCAVLRDQGVHPPEERVNLVFMGMGEPFLNYENFMGSVGLLVEGVGIPESRMTVSTAGIVPRITDFGSETVRPKLAISLNAPNDELRSGIMPLNRKWDLKMVLAAAREFPLRPRERLTFEYVLLDGVNDAADHARELVDLVRGIRAKVNLIALNPGPGIEFGTPSAERVQKFQSILIAGGIPTFLRRPRGRDIFAACGQLKGTVEGIGEGESRVAI
jgi:23S rRNA (adenine2503-C2)-methyltransferase